MELRLSRDFKFPYHGLIRDKLEIFHQNNDVLDTWLIEVELKDSVNLGNQGIRIISQMIGVIFQNSQNIFKFLRAYCLDHELFVKGLEEKFPSARFITLLVYFQNIFVIAFDIK